MSDLLSGVAVRKNYWAIVAPTPTLVTNNYLFSAEGKELHQMLCVCVQLLGCVQPFATLWAITHQALCSWEFSGKNTRVSCHFLLQEIFPTQGLSQCLLRSRIAGEFFTTEPLGKPTKYYGANNMWKARPLFLRSYCLQKNKEPTTIKCWPQSEGFGNGRKEEDTESLLARWSFPAKSNKQKKTSH